MTAARVFTPEQVAEMRQRLNQLHDEFIRESDPATWVGRPHEVRDQKQRCTHVLKMIDTLQRILERIPAAPGAAAAGDDSAAQRVAEAKRLGAQLRERMKAVQ